MKKTLPVVMLCMLPLSAVIFLFYCLETYNSIVHNDSGFFVCLYSVFMFIVSLIIWLKNKSYNKCLTFVFAVATAVLCAVFYFGNKIPFCVECEHVTAEDLGFLIHWIAPIDAQ